jgi:hypothetical protein
MFLSAPYLNPQLVSQAPKMSDGVNGYFSNNSRKAMSNFFGNNFTKIIFTVESSGAGVASIAFYQIGIGAPFALADERDNGASLGSTTLTVERPVDGWSQVEVESFVLPSGGIRYLAFKEVL